MTESDPDRQIDPREVEALFHRANELPPAERSRFLSVLREDRETLALAVEALISAANRPSFLDRPADLSALQAGDTQASGGPPAPGAETELREDVLLGAELGDFRLVNRLGAGGMGVVYLADQLSPRRSVALKVLGQHAAGTSAARRFLLEIETLARLDHPNIARIHGAGERDIEGRTATWFAMELIEDPVALDVFCKERSLDLETRLHAARAVCDAIHHAHRRGFLHRDLKGANLLVPAASEDARDVKVIDFGVARTLGEQDSVELERTRGGELLGTLATMSPEQAGGENDSLDVRSDVYSLGVVLYQLVCGSLPYELQGIGVLEVLRRIREEKPLDARRAGGPFTVNDDLWAILRCALEKEPELRYDSAGDLRDDLDRWLGHEPVRARRASPLHRLRLFAKRRRGLAISTAAAAAFVLLAGVAFVMLHLRMNDTLRRYEEADARAFEQEEAVRTARADLGALSSTLGDMVASTLVERSEEDLWATSDLSERREIVARCYEDLRRIDASLEGRIDSAGELADAYKELGRMYGEGWNASADDSRVAGLAHQREMTLRRQMALVPDAPMQTRLDHLEAVCRYVQAQRKLIDFEELGSTTPSGQAFATTRATIDEGVALARRITLDDPEDDCTHAMLIAALWARSDLFISAPLELRETGLNDMKEAVELCERICAEGYPDFDWREMRAFSHFRYGLWLSGWGRLQESVGHMQRGSELGLEYAADLESLEAISEDRIRWAGYELVTLVNMECSVLDRVDRNADAVARLREALAVLETHLAKSDHPDVLGTWSTCLISVWSRDPEDRALLAQLRERWLDIDVRETVRFMVPEEWIGQCLEARLFAQPELHPLLEQYAHDALDEVGSERTEELMAAVRAQGAELEESQDS